MEIKLLQEFDYSNKNSLFEHMDNMNDAIVKEIRESGNSLYITLHEFDEILSPNGDVMYPYKELEIEYKYAKNNCLNIDIHGDRLRRVTLDLLIDWVKSEKAELEMHDWMIEAGGFLLLKLLVNPKNVRRKTQGADIDIRLLPQKIIYRWM